MLELNLNTKLALVCKGFIAVTIIPILFQINEPRIDNPKSFIPMVSVVVGIKTKIAPFFNVKVFIIVVWVLVAIGSKVDVSFVLGNL